MRNRTKVRIKRILPAAVLNWALLHVPALYRTKTVYFESNLVEDGGIDDLLGQLEHVHQLDGDVIECGSSRCGTSIVMAEALRLRGVAKSVLACDSFEGFDQTELAAERSAGLAAAPGNAFTTTSLDYVRKKLRALGYAESVLPIPGYFRDSLPHINNSVCFGLIDCDLRDSLTFCAEWLWARLPSTGRILFDDYTNVGFAGARLGVDSFIEAHREEISQHGLLNRLYYVCKA